MNVQPRELTSFASIGILATLLYAFLAWLAIDLWQLQPAVGSVLAYICSATFSYLGHRYLTFRSKSKPAAEIRRFIFLTFVGITASTLLMQIGSEINVPSLALIVAITICIPVINYAALKFWVFRQQNTLG